MLNTCTHQFDSPSDCVPSVGVNHQVSFSSYKKRIPTFPIPILHLVLSFQMLQCFLCDVDPPINDNKIYANTTALIIV